MLGTSINVDVKVHWQIKWIERQMNDLTHKCSVERGIRGISWDYHTRENNESVEQTGL